MHSGAYHFNGHLPADSAYKDRAATMFSNLPCYITVIINPRALRGVTVLVTSVSQSLSVRLSVCQLPAMAASNSHKSETTSSVTTKRNRRMGSIAFSDIIPLKSLLTKREARKVTEMVQFSQKNVETIPSTYMFGQRYQQVGNREMSKYIWETTCKLFVGKLP